MPRWSWTAALIGAATTAFILGRPRDPTFHLISVELSAFRLNLPLLDVELALVVHVTNPNVVPIHYAASTMSIFYDGALLGTAQVEAGSQDAKSCQVLRLPARLDGLELAHHAKTLLADAARGEMALDASVDIAGTARVLWWEHRFAVHVDSHVVVDPVHLDVVSQENRSETQVYLA